MVIMDHKEGRSSYGWFNKASENVESPYPENGKSPYPENGELECGDFLGISQHLESVAMPVVALLAFVYAFPRLSLPDARSCACPNQGLVGRRILLLLLCLVFGIELGVKLAMRRIFWIDKPGYLATLLQIFILVAPPTRIMTAVFRLQMHMLFGIPVVVFFPIINSQLSLFEVVISFIQHVLMLVIVFYLMHSGDPYIPEPLGDVTWACMAFVLLFLYHFLPLHLLTYVTQFNLNSIYPPLLGPGQSKFYYLLAFCHQIILIPTFGKLLVIIAKAFNILPCSSSLDVKNESTPCSKPVRPCLDVKNERSPCSKPVHPCLDVKNESTPCCRPVGPCLDVKNERSPCCKPVCPCLDVKNESTPCSRPVHPCLDVKNESTPCSRPVHPCLDVKNERSPCCKPVCPYLDVKNERSPCCKPVYPCLDVKNESTPCSRPVHPCSDVKNERSPCSKPVRPCLDVKNESTPCSKSVYPGRVGSCSGDAWKRSSASGNAEEYNTDEDSGCVGSSSPLNTGYRRYSKGSSQRSCCRHYRSPCCSPHRSCLKHHEEWCCGSYCVHTRCIVVNGKLIGEVRGDEAPCRRWAQDTSSHNHGKPSLSGTGENMFRSFLLSDSLESSPEVPTDRNIHALDLETS